MQLFGGGVRYLTEKDMANTSAGVNLYQGTKDFSGTNWVFNGGHSQVNSFRAIKNAYQDFTALEVNTSWNGARQDILANFGETYTFSGFIKKGTGNPNVLFFGNPQGVANIGSADSDGKQINITDGWSRFSITFTVTKGGIVQPRIESSNGGPDATYFIAGLKLERGAVATQWCPAPEDYVMNNGLMKLFDLSKNNVLNPDNLADKTFDLNSKWYGMKIAQNDVPINGKENWSLYFDFELDGHNRIQINISIYNNIYIRSFSGVNIWSGWKQIGTK